jgi:hypothetical protein
MHNSLLTCSGCLWYYVCSEGTMPNRNKAYQVKYRQTEHYKTYQRAYKQSATYKAYQKVYNQSDNARVSKRRTPEQNSWAAMIQRCTYPKSKSWQRYGGAGVKVCERWLQFENFLVDMGPRPVGTTLSRFADSGDYQPGNCAWHTRKEQWTERRKKC